MSLRRRVEHVEDLIATGERSALQPLDLEERRAAMIASLERTKERARREAAAGDSRRLRAVEQLEAEMKKRVSERSSHER